MLKTFLARTGSVSLPSWSMTTVPNMYLPGRSSMATSEVSPLTRSSIATSNTCA